jgi:hypothetical protein
MRCVCEPESVGTRENDRMDKKNIVKNGSNRSACHSYIGKLEKYKRQADEKGRLV